MEDEIFITGSDFLAIYSEYEEAISKIDENDQYYEDKKMEAMGDLVGEYIEKHLGNEYFGFYYDVDTDNNIIHAYEIVEYKV